MTEHTKRRLAQAVIDVNAWTAELRHAVEDHRPQAYLVDRPRVGVEGWALAVAMARQPQASYLDTAKRLNSYVTVYVERYGQPPHLTPESLLESNP